jgi:hypothetical protein
MNGFVFSIIIVLCVFSAAGCIPIGKSGHDGLSFADCLPERKSIDTLSNQSGSILVVADHFIILSQSGESRFLPCNLPESYKKEGLKVKYTLVEKEIFPNERHIASPCYLTKIETE